MLVLKGGAVYFVLVFAVGWVLGPIRELWVIPRFGRTAGVLSEAPLMLAAIMATARWVVRRFFVDYSLGARGSVGLVALGFLLIAETMGIWWTRGMSVSDYLATFDTLSGGVFLLLLLLYAAMPMLVERRGKPSGLVRA